MSTNWSQESRYASTQAELEAERYQLDVERFMRIQSKSRVPAPAPQVAPPLTHRMTTESDSVGGNAPRKTLFTAREAMLAALVGLIILLALTTMNLGVFGSGLAVAAILGVAGLGTYLFSART